MKNEKLFEFIYHLYINLDADYGNISDEEFYEKVKRNLINTNIGKTNCLEYSLILLKQNFYEENIDLNKEEKLYKILDSLLYKLLHKYGRSFFNYCVRREWHNAQQNAFFVKNFASLKRMMRSQKRNVLEENYNLSFFSKEDTLSLVFDFFKKIDPSETWYQIILADIKNGKIVLWKDSEPIPQVILDHLNVTDYYAWGVYPPILNGPLTETLMDAAFLVHEAIHYISLKESYSFDFRNEVLDSFEEVPSIFYEMLFYEYLKENKKVSDEAKIIQNNRIKENSSNIYYSELFQALANLKTSKKRKQSISKNDMIELIDLITKNQCESSFQWNYVLAYQIFQKLYPKIKSGDLEILTKMKNITHFLCYSSMDPIYILKYLGIEKDFPFQSINEKEIPSIEDFTLRKQKID